MKRQTRLIALFCVLAVAVGAAVGLSLYSEEAEQIAESGEVVFELPVDEVTALSWEYTDEEGETVSLAFTNDGGWSYDGDASFPVDGEALTELLDYFAAMPAAFVIEDVTDYGQYGLEEPLCTINITAGETEYEIALGDYSELDYQRYLSLGDGRAYLVNDDPMELYKITLDDLMLDDTIPAFVDVERVEFSGAENYVIERDENGGSYRAGDVYYTENGEVLDTDSVNDFVTYIAALALGDYYTYDAAEADLAETGLDDPELTVTIDYPESGEEDAEALTFTISFSRSATDKLTDWDEVLAALEAEEEASDSSAESAEPTDADAVAYLRVGESAIIYEIGYDTFKALMACSYDDLRHTEIFPAEVEDVASLSVTLDGGTYARQGDRGLQHKEQDRERLRHRADGGAAHQKRLHGLREPRLPPARGGKRHPCQLQRRIPRLTESGHERLETQREADNRRHAAGRLPLPRRGAILRRAHGPGRGRRRHDGV